MVEDSLDIVLFNVNKLAVQLSNSLYKRELYEYKNYNVRFN
jgi:hypothetical protein